MSTPVTSEQNLRWVYLAVGGGIGLVIGLVLSGAFLGSPSRGGTFPSSACPPPTVVAGPTVVSCSGIVGNSSSVTAPPVRALGGSLLFVFVSYVNFQIGGGAPTTIADSVGDSYFLLASTGYLLNHTESIYVTSLVSADPKLTVSVSFAGGVTPQGGSVAVVDVADATLSSIDTVSSNAGVAGPASVTVVAKHTGDLFLFGCAGREVSGPYTPGAGETLLDTGTADAGPFQDGVAYGTLESTSTNSVVILSANLNTPTYWEAIGVAIGPQSP